MDMDVTDDSKVEYQGRAKYRIEKTTVEADFISKSAQVACEECRSC